MTYSRASLGLLCALALTFGSIEVASAQRILVYGPGGTTATASFPVGATVTVANAAMWASLTQANFQSYDAIWIDSASCSFDPALFAVARANRSVWSPAVVGRVVVSGADLDFHNTASAQQLMRQIAGWIGGLGASAEGGSTGLFVSFGCTLLSQGPTTTASAPVDMLDGFGAFSVSGNSGDPSVVDAHPITTGLTPASLVLSQFGHAVIPVFPLGWASIVRFGTENQVVVRNDCVPVTVPMAGFSVAEGGSTPLTAMTTASAAAVQWDLNGDGTYETTGNPVAFSAAGLDGPSVRTIRVRTTGACASVSVPSSVSVVNLNPMVTSTPPVTVTAGATLTYPITTTDPAGALDPRTFVRTTGPTGSAVGASTGVLTWTPGFAAAGMTAPFLITVSDGDGGTVTHSFSVSVSCPDADSDGVPDGRCPGESDCNDGDATIFPGATELCDTVDQDCDGAVANGFMLGTTCSAGVGTCVASGVLVCNSTTATRCSAVPGTPAAERCGSLADEDCDGMTDEGFNVGDSCSVGVGICVASGAKVCTSDALTTECDAVAGAAGTESCNGLDDDCNGTLDDGGDALCAVSGDGTMCVAVGPLAACGCAADADCGDATSGRICDLDSMRCADGCGVGTDRNGCPADRFCTSMDPAVDGLCTTSCNFNVDCAASPEVPFCFVDGSGGFCVECTTDIQCGGRTDGRDRCVGPDHTCAACSATDTTSCTASGDGSACVSGLCGCASDADCASDRMCDTVGDVCVDRPTPDGGMPDAGVVMLDAGVMVDVGGGTADGGIGADAGPGGPTGGACGCSVPGAERGRSGLAGLGLLALALVLTCRRKSLR